MIDSSWFVYCVEIFFVFEERFYKNYKTVGWKTMWVRTNLLYHCNTSNTFGLEVFLMLFIKSNAIGLDGVPLEFLKLILSQVSGIVTHIFNTILTTSIYPAAWKTTKIMPIAYTSEPSNISDYRPISVLSVLSKAIEIIMKRQINAFLMDKGRLSDYQCGFRTHHSTSAALLKITNDLFSKAFDSVNHHLLCSKLSSQFGFTTSSVSLIMSYLSDRSQCVQTDGVLSNVLLTIGKNPIIPCPSLC
jgi:hypothetical protein